MDDYNNNQNGFNPENNQPENNQSNNQEQQNYNPYSNGTYYTPPTSNNNYGNDNSNNDNNNSTYHYSYVNNDTNTNTNNNQNNTDYQSENTTYYSEQSTVDETKPKKEKKKNNTVVIIVVVLIACIIIAVAGIGAGIINSASDDSDNNSTSQSEETDDSTVEANDSEAVATQDGSGNYTVAGVYEKVVDSCVGITVYTETSSAYNYFYGYGSSSSDDDSSSEASGEGSGVIMQEKNSKTYIMTCAHVISDGDSFIVTLNDGTEYEATMVGYDSQTDIGVLSIDATGLQVAEFGDSDQLVVGEQVVAIGCPGGLEFMNSTTSGYISALDRPITSSIGYDNNCIQTDAAINPGNSGGALFNMQGQVIGINSSKIASTEYEGMGFAVPTNTALSTANSLIKVGYVEGRAKIGITYTALTNYNNASSIISALAEQGFDDAEGTMVINEVDSESDLANKDIQQYDMIVAINGETLTSTDIVTSVLSDSAPGDTVTLTIARIENNSITTFEVDCTLIESKG